MKDVLKGGVKVFIHDVMLFFRLFAMSVVCGFGFIIGVKIAVTLYG